MSEDNSFDIETADPNNSWNTPILPIITKWQPLPKFNSYDDLRAVFENMSLKNPPKFKIKDKVTISKYNESFNGATGEIVAKYEINSSDRSSLWASYHDSGKSWMYMIQFHKTIKLKIKTENNPDSNLATEKELEFQVYPVPESFLEKVSNAEDFILSNS